MLLLSLLAMAAPGAGKTMAHDDWHALSVIEVGGDAATSPYYLRVAADDLDGDGKADDAILKLDCADGKVTSAAMRPIKEPREASTGMASGKRQYAPVKIIKQWGAATPELRAMKAGYDVKKMEGARSAVDDWWPVNLSNSDGLCPAAEAAAAAIVKSKSNITNN